MGLVLVDAPALTVSSAVGGHRALAPGALDAIRRLGEGGHEVVVVGLTPHEAAELLHVRVRTTESVPESTEAGWFITGDIRRCGKRRHGLRMILVGPAVTSRTLPTRHCDEEVRDLTQAAMSILLSDAMPTPPGPAPTD